MICAALSPLQISDSVEGFLCGSVSVGSGTNVLSCHLARHGTVEGLEGRASAEKSAQRP